MLKAIEELRAYEKHYQSDCFLMNGHDLVLQYGTDELMTVKNQDNNDMKIEKFELNDGSYLTNIDMDQIIQQLNAFKADQGISITNNDHKL
jgi:hypothetical protein